MNIVRILGVSCLFASFLLAGCGQGSESAQALPEAGTIPGWNPSGEIQDFGRDNLYDLVDGQADSFFVYGFEDVAVREYANAASQNLRIEVWQLAAPADAFGLFSISRAGQPVAMGNGGDGDPGRRLDFWQDRYFVRLFAPSSLDDTVLQAFAQEISARLPAGGAPPHLLERLPTEGLVQRSEVFFHSEISIQDRLWLGGENILGLGAGTDGILARYSSDEGLSWLLLVEYPDTAQASTALQSLEPSGIPDLVAAEQQGNLLGAVFGQASEATARRWLQLSLSPD
jgi:hypothetical protein